MTRQRRPWEPIELAKKLTTKEGKMETNVVALIISKYLSEMGKRGGKKSRRKLTAEQARAMVNAREQKRKIRENGKGI